MKESVVAATVVVAVVAVPVVPTAAAAANEAPLVDAGLDQTVAEGATVLLDGGGSRDPDGEIASYEWTVETPGGSTTSPDCRDCVRTEFVAAQPGVYEVTLTATDDDGAGASDVLYVTVEEDDEENEPTEPDPGPEPDPTVSLTGPDAVERGADATFVATPDADQPVRRYDWSGSPAVADASGDSVTAAFDRSPGTTVTLGVTVTFEDGSTARDTHAVDVVGAGEPEGPTVDLRADRDEVEPGGEVTFTPDASSPVGITDYEYLVEGMTVETASTAEALVREFDGPPGRSVDVSVVVTDDRGRTAADTETVDVVSDAAQYELTLSGDESVQSGNYGDYAVSSSTHEIVDVDWSPADGSTNGDVTTYRRQFTEAPGSTVEVTAVVKLEGVDGRVQRSMMVTIPTDTGGGQTRRNPILGDIAVTVETRGDNYGANGQNQNVYVFSVPIQHESGDNVQVTMAIYGETKTQTVQNAPTPNQSSRVVEFSHTFTHRDGSSVKTKWVSASVEAVDTAGDTDTASWRGSVESYLVNKDTVSNADVAFSVNDPETASHDDYQDDPHSTGSTVSVTVGGRTGYIVYWGDGTETQVGPTESGDSSFAQTHTHIYNSPGEYTVSVTATGGRGASSIDESYSFTIEDTTYTVYEYEEEVISEITKESTTSPGSEWEQGEQVDTDYESTDRTTWEESWSSGYYNKRNDDSWRRESKTRRADDTRTDTTWSTTHPGARTGDYSWSRTGDRRCTNRRSANSGYGASSTTSTTASGTRTSSDDLERGGSPGPSMGIGGFSGTGTGISLGVGVTTTGVCISWEDKYQRTTTTYETHYLFRYYDGTPVYEWTKTETTYETTQSLEKPADGTYRSGTLTTTEYECSDEDAPFHDQACS